MPIGVPELIIILIVVLLIFGPKRLPLLGRQLGGGMREFKDSISGKGKGESGEDDAAPADAAGGRPELTRAQQRPRGPRRPPPPGGPAPSSPPPPPRPPPRPGPPPAGATSRPRARAR